MAFVSLLCLAVSSTALADPCTMSNITVSGVSRNPATPSGCTITLTVGFTFDNNNGFKHNLLYLYNGTPPSPSSPSPACSDIGSNGLIGIVAFDIPNSDGSFNELPAPCSGGVAATLSGTRAGNNITLSLTITGADACSAYASLGANIYGSNGSSASPGTANWQCRNGLITTPIPLPIKFGDGNARRNTHQQLLVDWQSFGESNVNEYVIQASPDGIKWTNLKKVAAKSANNITGDEMSYAVAIDLTGISFAGMAIFSLLLLPILKSRKLRFALTLGVLLILGACLKNEVSPSKTKNVENLWVRIMQYNNDGSAMVSKVIKVVNE